MIYLISILAIVAVWHFVYESIFAPALRMSLRNQLFVCRDQLRWAMIENPNMDHEVFIYMQESINNAIRYLHALRLSTAVSIQAEIRRNQGLRRLVATRTAAIDNCGIQDIVDLNRRVTEVTARAIAFNAGGWLCWLIPIALVIGLWKKVLQTISQLLAIPEKDAKRLGPPEDMALA
jgi:hypothetical protein